MDVIVVVAVVMSTLVNGQKWMGQYYEYTDTWNEGAKEIRPWETLYAYSFPLSSPSLLQPSHIA